MEKKRLGNICKEIWICREERRFPDEEQAHILFEGIVDCLAEGGWEAGTDYQKLSDSLHEVWQYKELDEVSAEEAFLLGGLWGSIRILELYLERKRSEKKTEKLTADYRNNFDFLDAIHSNPGICHKELAKKLKQSPSQLSQVVSRLAKDGMFSCDRTGREKHYYLRKRGEEVYRELKKERKVSQRNSIYSWNVSIQNNFGPKEAVIDCQRIQDALIERAFQHLIRREASFNFVGNTEMGLGELPVVKKGGAERICQNLLNSF